jgi:hypothetical protein
MPPNAGNDLEAMIFSASLACDSDKGWMIGSPVTFPVFDAESCDLAWM